jgi:hypothetical protein
MPVQYQVPSHTIIAATNCHSLLRIRSHQKHRCHLCSYLLLRISKMFIEYVLATFVHKAGLILDRATYSGTLSETQQTHTRNVLHNILQVRVCDRYDPVQLSGMLGTCRSECPPGLSCGSMAVLLLGLRFRIPPGVWKSVSCECYVLSGRGHDVGLIICPETSFRM